MNQATTEWFPVNNDFEVSVIEHVLPGSDGPSILESIDNPPRLTRLHHLEPGSTLRTSNSGSEILVLQGDCYNDQQHFSHGHYLRFFDSEMLTTRDGCVVFEKSSQYQEGDKSNRVIDTNAGHLWLPGPVDGITICPLHVFRSESIMLLRWHETCEFKPRLDPQGEEILVVAGRLLNGNSTFKPYTWLRNPIEEWRRWRGSAGTLLYYKSGHFPT